MKKGTPWAGLAAMLALCAAPFSKPTKIIDPKRKITGRRASALRWGKQATTASDGTTYIVDDNGTVRRETPKAVKGKSAVKAHRKARKLERDQKYDDSMRYAQESIYGTELIQQDLRSDGLS